MYVNSTNNKTISNNGLFNWSIIQLDLDTTIWTNIILHNHDKILKQKWLQPEVDFNQLPHTHNAQTITDLIRIFFSQHNLITSLSDENISFRHRLLIKGESTYLTQGRIISSKHQQGIHFKMQNLEHYY